MEAVPVVLTAKELAQRALQANKEHHNALKIYTERLEAELQAVDKLLTSAEVVDQEDEPDFDAGGFIVIPGASKAIGPVPLGDLLSEDSPFYADAVRRQRYLDFTEIHPMKQKELDALTEAVRTENHRRHAFEAQQRGQEPFANIDDKNYFEMNKDGLDWERIAESVGNASIRPRSAKECEIRWLGERHPEFNHTTWTQPEIARLRVLAADYPSGRVDWVAVANKLGTHRTPVDCMRNALHRRNHIWTPEYDYRLLDAIRVYGTDNWIQVARVVSEDATAAQCQSRFYRTLDPSLKRGNWTDEEDEQLRRAVAAYGSSWMEVAALIPGRNNDQCRDRWSDKLDPTKGKWTDGDDSALLSAVEMHGEDWREVSFQVGDKYTDEMCRVRYNVLKKRTQAGHMNVPAGLPTMENQFSVHTESQSPDPELAPGHVYPRGRPRSTKSKSKAGSGKSASTHEQVPECPRPMSRSRVKGKAKETAGEAESPMDQVSDGTPPEKTTQRLRPNTRPRVMGQSKEVTENETLPATMHKCKDGTPLDEVAKRTRPKPRPLTKAKAVIETPSDAVPLRNQDHITPSLPDRHNETTVSDRVMSDDSSTTTAKVPRKRTRQSKETNAVTQKKRKTTHKAPPPYIGPDNQLKHFNVTGVLEGGINQVISEQPSLFGQQTSEAASTTTIVQPPSMASNNRSTQLRSGQAEEGLFNSPRKGEANSNLPEQDTSLNSELFITEASDAIGDDQSVAQTKERRSRRQAVAAEPTRKQPVRATRKPDIQVAPTSLSDLSSLSSIDE